MANNNVLMLASVASMIDLFNADNMNILEKLGCRIDVAANFSKGSITSQERVAAYRRELEVRDINVYNTPIPRSIFKIGDIIKSYKQIRKLTKEKHYRIVHCHSPIGGVVARFACRKARKTGTKAIYTAHGFHLFKGASLINWLIFYPIERLCSHFTDVLITINQEDYSRAKTWHTCDVKYVPGIGVHTEEFRKESVDRVALRNELGIKESDFVFLSVGQLSVRKNHEVVIRALAKINNPKVKYLLVGFGELEDKLKLLAKDLNIADRVIFSGYRGDVRKILHVVDAFAFPSLQEGLPVSLMEAMSVGLPIVCSAVRGNEDLVENGKGGYVYGCHDVDGFAEGMSEIVAGKGYEMGRHNISVMKNFDINTVNKIMTELYKDNIR